MMNDTQIDLICAQLEEMYKKINDAVPHNWIVDTEGVLEENGLNDVEITRLLDELTSAIISFRRLVPSIYSNLTGGQQIKSIRSKRHHDASSKANVKG